MLTECKFPPQNRQNTLFISMQAKSFLHQCIMVGVLHYIENSNRNRLVPKSFGFLSFGGNSGTLSGRKLTFLTTVYACLVRK